MGPSGTVGYVAATASSGISSSLDMLQQLSVRVPPRSSRETCKLCGELLSRNLAVGAKLIAASGFTIGLGDSFFVEISNLPISYA